MQYKCNIMKGTKVEFLGTLKGFNQEYIAKKSDIEISRYKRIEADLSKADTEELKKIASLLGTTTDDLLNPNPYVIQISHSPQSLGNGTYNNYVQEDIVSLLKNKDEQINRLLGIIESRK